MSQLWQLYRLGQLDQEMDRKIKEKEGMKDPKEMIKTIEKIEKEIAENDETRKKLSLNIKKLELENSGIEDHRKKIEKKLYSGKTTNPKELQNWQAEIESLKKKQYQKEETILEMMEELEAIDKKREANLKEIEKCKSQMEVQLREYEEKNNQLQNEIQNLLEKRKKIAETVEESLLKKYEQLRKIKEDGVAVVKIEDGVCGGCYMNIPDSMIKKVKDHYLVTCHNCMRILYWGGEG